MKYKIAEYARLNKVQYRTVWNWVKQGKVKSERTETGGVLIVVDEPIVEKSVAIYARISPDENKANLDSQAKLMVAYANAKGYKVAKVVKEVGSGLNDNRPKLIALLRDLSIGIIIVEHKDRLARFGFNYLEVLLAMQDRKIEVVNNIESPKEDLLADFTSIIASFGARIYDQKWTKSKIAQLIDDLQTKHNARNG